MQVTGFRISSPEGLSRLPDGAPNASWLADEGERWVDVSDADESQLREILAPLDLHPMVMRRVCDWGKNLRPGTYHDGLVLDFRVKSELSAARPDYLTLIALPTTLVTVHHKPLKPVADLAEELLEADDLGLSDTSDLLFRILSGMIDRDFELIVEARTQTDELSNHIDSDASSVELAEIVMLRRSAQSLSITIEDQAYGVSMLLSMESNVVALARIRGLLRELQGRLEHALRLITRMETRQADLQQQIRLYYEGQTEKKLNVLTALSAVFLPLTLIAGIYGMNFQYMPELGWSWGYPAVLLIMAALALAMSTFMYLRGWFR